MQQEDGVYCVWRSECDKPLCTGCYYYIGKNKNKNFLKSIEL